MTPLKYMKFWIAAALLASCPAYAQQSPGGNTSGPAAGSVVDPHADVQKRFHEQRSVQPGTTPPPVTPGATGGMPGVESKPGTEGGRMAPEQVPVR